MTISQSIAPFVSLLSTVGISIAAVGVIAFAAGRTFGGSSRLKRQGVFLLVSVAGFVAIAAYVNLKLRSLPTPPARPPSAMPPAELSVRVGGFLRPSFVLELTGDKLSCEERHGSKSVGRWQVQPSAAQWASLRAELDALDIWSWRASYEATGVEDGTQWRVRIRYADRQLASEGSNDYPGEHGRPGGSPRQTPGFERFRAAFGSLLPACRL